MNLPVNPSSEPPKQPDGNLPSASSHPSPPSQPTQGSNSETPASETASSRNQPIPPPSDPMQYRAIGLIRGKYEPSQELVKGNLITTEGTVVDAVVLGRVISLVKNHLDLAQNHLWVVYPRTQQEDDVLHGQIVGVWEPETLKPAETATEQIPSEVLPDGYFSIRGEVVYYSEEQEKVIVKIVQAPRKRGERPKSFKLKLKGKLPERPVGHFWDLNVELQQSLLVIQDATDIGELPTRRGKGRNFPKKGRPFKGKGRRPFPRSEPEAKPNRPPVSRPIKRKDKNSEGS